MVMARLVMLVLSTSALMDHAGQAVPERRIAAPLAMHPWWHARLATRLQQVTMARLAMLALAVAEPVAVFEQRQVGH